MEELLFFAVIIFFSIIESISRSRKAKKGGGSEEDSRPGLPSPREIEKEWQFEWAQKSPDELSTYDADSSYEEHATHRREAERAPRSLESTRPSSESMLPGSLLEDLADLASQLEQERTGARKIRLPKQSPPLPEPAAPQAPTRARTPNIPVPTRSRAPSPRERGPARPPGDHRIHQAHAGYGTDPSQRAKSEQDDLDPLATFLSRDARAIRSQLRSHRKSALRQAVILQEVLAEPVALRDGERVGR